MTEIDYLSNKLILNIISMFGKLGIRIFVMISDYYMIDSKSKALKTSILSTFY